MKSILFTTFVILISTMSVIAQSESGITFEKTTHDFGIIEKGSKAVYGFKFKNTGKNPLTLTNVKSSCGCTTPYWPKEPVKKRKEGLIKVKYNTNAVGSFSKSVTVYSNATNSPVVLRIKGKVVKNAAK